MTAFSSQKGICIETKCDYISSNRVKVQRWGLESHLSRTNGDFRLDLRLHPILQLLLFKSKFIHVHSFISTFSYWHIYVGETYDELHVPCPFSNWATLRTCSHIKKCIYGWRHQVLPELCLLSLVLRSITLYTVAVSEQKRRISSGVSIRTQIGQSLANVRDVKFRISPQVSS